MEPKEKWREELMILLHKITVEYDKWEYAKFLYSPLEAFIADQIAQAERRGYQRGFTCAIELPGGEEI